MTNRLWREKFKALYASPESHLEIAVQAKKEGRQIMELVERMWAEYKATHQLDFSSLHGEPAETGALNQ